MKITVNPETTTGGFSYASEGRYRLRVVSCTQQEGKAYPYLRWEFEFADPNTPAVEPGKKVGHVFENTTLKPEAQFALRSVTDALGLEWSDFDTEEVVGMELEASVKIKEYNGTLSNEIDKFHNA